MKILDRLPIPKTDALAQFATHSVHLKKDQIIVWVSVSDENIIR